MLISGGLKPLTSPKGDISFRNVVFSYENRPDAPILNGLNLEIPNGMIYALVGYSGSGKSTLGHLLLRLYDPQAGQVCLDETDIKMFDPVWLHNHIGVVSQVSAILNYSNKFIVRILFIFRIEFTTSKNKGLLKKCVVIN